MVEAEGILGRKLGMTHVFDPEGNIVPVTVIQAGPCKVIKRKTMETDNYNAVQVCFETIREKLVNKPVLGVYNKLGLESHRFLKEFRVSAKMVESYADKTELDVNLFESGEYVDVTGTSKGRGFQGVMKRHGFGGSKATHGVHEFFRHGGSIGASAYPARVFKGKKMPGQYGNTRITVQNLQVIHVISDHNIILIKGAIPGPTKGLVEIRRAAKVKRTKAGAL